MKSVVITGASTGIGRATAEYLASQGWKVFAGVRKPADGDVLTAANPAIHPLILDVTKPDQIAAAADQVSANLQGEKLSGLINNAGVAIIGPLAVQPLDEIRQHFDINVLGLLATVQGFAPLLGMDTELTGKPGRIVNISSFGGRMAPPFLSAYAATKHAVESLTDSLRREFMAYGIDAICVAPGAVKTPIWDKAEEDEKREPYANTRWANAIRKFTKSFLEAGEQGWPAERVAKTIETALTHPKPKVHYAIGPEKLVNYSIARRLPKRMLDKGFANRFGMKPPE
jgi:NAD(P)-dependent dehydrogenase (short-subunit alcohol dehydrogenase family)